MSNELERLISIVKKLRAPDGCDWDNVQTSKSLTPYLLEEVYEVIEAIETEDINLLKEELGDLLLHVIIDAGPMRSQVASGTHVGKWED